MNTGKYDFIKIEKKWQEEWFINKIYESNINNNKKFFIHFAYPGVSGYLHIGHMRGFTYCDIFARYKRMTGYNVLFPAGFHASGIPSIGFAKKVERKDPHTIKILKEYGCNDELINKLKDPNEVVNYFSKIYVDDYWKKFGLLIDYSRIMSTISIGYKKFITWQFLKLKENNLLIKKPHFAPYCPNCGPVAVDKSETDISKGGNAEILEFTIIKFEMDDGTILPAATLRPETIYGITNMWVNPDVEYTKIKINDEIWIISIEGAKKLSFQLDNITILNEKILGKELLGKKCKIPLLNREVPILSGHFADPNVATGIVMSVPSHAPYDYIALIESKEEIEPITIIEVKELGCIPAKQVCEELKINNQNEIEKLDNATEIVYKKEFHTGYLNEKCGKYVGIKVSDIKDQVKNELISNNKANIMKEFSEEVICRCSGTVIIKKIPDQWFIKYSDYTLTSNSKKHVEKMNIYPQEYKQELPGILDWYDDRACIRKGSWLGTEFPFKKDWIIEPISDSTLYPAYYIISKYVNENKISTDEMNEEFFDYIFLNKGKSKDSIWDKIKSDFEYWYPVDINLGGKEHKTVHFPVFLMNHVAILPYERYPKGIFTHWWITQKNKEKISKSKGGVEHISEAAIKYGIDSMRLYYSHIGSTYIDIEWDSESVIKYKNRIVNIFKLYNKLMKINNKRNVNLDNWLISSLNRRIKIINESLNNFDLRIASNEIFFEINKDIQWYLKRGGANQEILLKLLKKWSIMMTPITPHLSEELWYLLQQNKFISEKQFPQFKSNDIYENEEIGEFLISKLIDDANEIIKVTKIKPKKIFIYVSPEWKKIILKKSLRLYIENDFNLGNFIKNLMSDFELKKNSKKVLKYVNKIQTEIKKFNVLDQKRYLKDFNSYNYLIDSKDYLEKIFKCNIEIFKGDNENIYDPEERSKFAVPLRPAIYIQ